MRSITPKLQSWQEVKMTYTVKLLWSGKHVRIKACIFVRIFTHLFLNLHEYMHVNTHSAVLLNLTNMYIGPTMCQALSKALGIEKFSNLSTVDIWDQMIPSCWRGWGRHCPMHCRIFSRTLDLYLLNASSSTPTQSELSTEIAKCSHWLRTTAVERQWRQNPNSPMCAPALNSLFAAWPCHSSAW